MFLPALAIYMDSLPSQCVEEHIPAVMSFTSGASRKQPSSWDSSDDLCMSDVASLLETEGAQQLKWHILVIYAPDIK